MNMEVLMRLIEECDLLLIDKNKKGTQMDAFFKFLRIKILILDCLLHDRDLHDRLLHDRDLHELL